MHARDLRIGAALALTALSLVVLSPPALADLPNPTDHQLSTADESVTTATVAVGRLSAQLATADEQLSAARSRGEVAVERWHAAVYATRRAAAAAQAANKTAVRAGAEVAAKRRVLGHYVAHAYESSGVTVPLMAVLSAQNPQDLLHSAGTLQVIGRRQTGALDQVRSARTRQANASSAARAALRKQLAARSAAVAAKSAALSQLAGVRQQLAGIAAHKRVLQTQLVVEQQRAGVLHQARAAAVARARAAATARAAAVRAAAVVPAPVPSAGSPGDSRTATTAINAALAQRGVPYAWGGGTAAGASPDIDGTGVVGYDCSGLLLYAWAKVGVYLPHSSQADYVQGYRVPLSARQPGDLIFYSSNGTTSGIHHVSMYLGGGQMVEAPTFGIPVRIHSLYYDGIMPSVVRLT